MHHAASVTARREGTSPLSHMCLAYTMCRLYYHGRTHRTHACTDITVRYAEEIYGADAAILGYSFDDARRSCREFGQSELPTTVAPISTEQQNAH